MFRKERISFNLSCGDGEGFMSITDVFMGLGALLFIIVIIFILLAPVIVAIYFADLLGVHGVTWYAFVIVLYVIEVGLIGLLYK